MEKGRTIIHLHYLTDDTHHYFGSIARMFETFTTEQLGISYGSLRNRGLSVEHPYSNGKCIIRKGILLSKHIQKKNEGANLLEV